MKQAILFISFCLSCFISFTQPVPFIFKGALKQNRQQLYRNLVNNINKDLSLPLTDSTEENWEDAFAAMELINYKSAWTDHKIFTAFSNIQKRTIEFQRALLELAYA